MLKCDNCKKVFTEVMNVRDKKLCYKCYAEAVERDKLKVVRLIMDNFPEDIINQIVEETKEDNILTFAVLKKYFNKYLSDLKAGVYE